MEVKRYIYLFVLISEKLKAIREVWVVGTEFLDSMYDMFIEMRKQAKKDNRRLPYLYEQYNISYLLQDQLEGAVNPLSQLYNALVKGLNMTPHKLPHMIVLVPENDILKTINFYGFGISLLIGKCLDWLINEIDHAVTKRRNDIEKT